MMNYLIFAVFALTVPLSNWMIGHVGDCSQGIPCTLAVAPGIQAPSAVVVIGLALVLRDLIHQRMGLGTALFAILCGAWASIVVADPRLGMASCAAFLGAELIDLLVYHRLRCRPALAIALSGAAGAVVDTILFLSLAFGSLEFFTGQIIGKMYASMIVAATYALIPHRTARHD